MELAFIWVENYRSLKDISINFSKEFDFFYDAELSSLSRKAKTEISTKNFYGTKVLNLTAIIGENGVGKTSLFNLIKIVYHDIRRSFDLHSREKASNQSYLVVMKIAGEFLYFKNNLNSMRHSEVKELPHLVKDLANMSLVYYSNFFDYSRSESSDKLIDISTSSLVNDLLIETASKAEDIGSYKYLENFSYSFKSREILSQLEFISKFDKYIPFDAPLKLAIKPSYTIDPTAYDLDTDSANTKLRLKSSKQSPNYPIAIETIARILLRLKEIGKPQKVSPTFVAKKRTLQQAALINFVEEFFFQKENKNQLRLFEFDISKLISREKISSAKTPDSLFKYVFDKLFSHFKVRKNGKELLDLIEEFTSIIETGSGTSVESNSTNIELSENISGHFKELVGRLTDYPFPPFLEIFWEGISSGENALLTLFSRINKVRRQLNKKGSTVLYLLDECELNFHPDWQRKLVMLLTTVLPQMTHNCNLQFVIASHSPLILSDIPKSNVIFLEKKDNKVRVSHLSERKQTFAANIHTLLSDAFFMKEGTIGEVAKEKINWVIDQINSRYAVFEQNLDEIKTIVNLIGEPVIRAKLATMINEKLEINLYNVDTRLRDLERKSNK